MDEKQPTDKSLWVKLNDGASAVQILFALLLVVGLAAAGIWLAARFF